VALVYNYGGGCARPTPRSRPRAPRRAGSLFPPTRNSYSRRTTPPAASFPSRSVLIDSHKSQRYIRPLVRPESNRKWPGAKLTFTPRDRSPRPALGPTLASPSSRATCRTAQRRGESVTSFHPIPPTPFALYEELRMKYNGAHENGSMLHHVVPAPAPRGSAAPGVRPCQRQPRRGDRPEPESPGVTMRSEVLAPFSKSLNGKRQSVTGESGTENSQRIVLPFCTQTTARFYERCAMCLECPHHSPCVFFQASSRKHGLRRTAPPSSATRTRRTPTRWSSGAPRSTVATRPPLRAASFQTSGRTRCADPRVVESC
jgi:hypothetical protein